MILIYRPDHPQADENGMVDKSIAGPRHEKRGAWSVITDTMPHVKHMGTGEMIDSKSRFRQATRASGYVEVGTDPSIKKEQPRYEPSLSDIVTDVKRSFAELNR